MYSVLFLSLLRNHHNLKKKRNIWNEGVYLQTMFTVDQCCRFLQNVLLNNSILHACLQKLKADVQLEGKDLNLLREEWRGIVARHLPL
jgi:hypothetical protein